MVTPPDTCTPISCSRLALGGVHPTTPGDFYRLDSPIPASKVSGFSVKHGSPDSRAEGIHACQDAKTPPGPSMTRINAMVDIAFPIQAQGRHPENVISELNVRETCLRFPLSTKQARSRDVTIAAA